MTRLTIMSATSSSTSTESVATSAILHASSWSRGNCSALGWTRTSCSITDAPDLLAGCAPSREVRNHLRAGRVERCLLGVVHQVEGELIDTERCELLDALYVGARRSEHAEAVDDLVRDEVGGRVARLAVVGVVVVGTLFDVVGQRLWDRSRTLAVPLDEIGHVVSDHATEPTHLIALMGKIPADVGGSGRTHRVRSLGALPARMSLPGDARRPFDEVGVGELQDQPVSFATGEVECLWTVGRHVDGERAIFDPRDVDVEAAQLDGLSGGETTDHPHRLGERLEFRRGTARDTNGGIAAADPAHGAISIHVVQSGEERCSDGPIPRERIRHHGSDCDGVCLGEDRRKDDEWLLPQEVRIERPYV